jgi:hypothetical protein
MASELRLYVHDLLGGLATPQTVAFVEAFPQDAGGDALVRALQGLCTASAAVQHISQEQLAATLRSFVDPTDGPAS